MKRALPTPNDESSNSPSARAEFADSVVAERKKNEPGVDREMFYNNGTATLFDSAMKNPEEHALILDWENELGKHLETQMVVNLIENAETLDRFKAVLEIVKQFPQLVEHYGKVTYAATGRIQPEDFITIALSRNLDPLETGTEYTIGLIKRNMEIYELLSKRYSSPDGWYEIANFDGSILAVQHISPESPESAQIRVTVLARKTDATGESVPVSSWGLDVGKNGLLQEPNAEASQLKNSGPLYTIREGINERKLLELLAYGNEAEIPEKLLDDELGVFNYLTNPAYYRLTI